MTDAPAFHPAANLFPLMEESALGELAADIAAYGLREPIWRHRDGRIIDGRNRWLACAKVGVTCHALTYEGDDASIVPFVVSRNLHRRPGRVERFRMRRFSISTTTENAIAE